MMMRKSLLELLSDLVGLGRTRFELFVLELSIERARLLKLLGCALGAFLLFVLAFLLFSVLLGVYFWPTDARYLALGGIAAVYAGGGLLLLYLVRRDLTRGPAPFTATLQELERDVQLLTRIRSMMQEEAQRSAQQKKPGSRQRGGADA